MEQPPNELLFSNQTGALVQCGVAFELAQGIARADRQRRRLAQARTQGGAVDSQAANNQQQPAIQIRWEKENGDEIETQLYASESSADSYSPGPAERPLERPLEQPLEQQRVNPNRPLLRYVRPSDGALVFEPFKPLDFRPEVHATSYRCVASVLIEPQQQQQPPHVFLQTSPPVVGLHSTNTNNNQNPVPASVVSRDMRVRAVVGPTTQQTSIKIEVLDELAIEGNSVTFRCQVPAYASAYLQLLDWRESPTESTFAVHQGSLALLFAAPSASFKHSSSVHLARRQNLNQTSSSSSLIQLASLQQQRYFVNPKTYELTILNVDASLHQRAYRCRCKNKLTGELLQSQNEGRLYLSESRAPFAPKLASYQLKSMASISGQQEAAFQDQQEHANKANLLNANLLVYEEGETALLVCHHQAYPRARIGWFKRDLVSLTDGLHETPLQAVQLDQDLALPALANEISNQTLMSASANTHQVLSKYIQLSNLLLVSRLSRNDSGVYVCRASNLMGQDRFSMSIEVRAPLKAKLSASSNVLELGKSLALECTISGWPVHQVVFKHNQQVIKTISGSDAQALLQQSPSTTQMRSDQDQGGQSSSDANYFVLDDLDPDEQNDDETGQDEREDDKKSPLPAATQQEQLNGGPPVRANSKLLSHVMVIVLEPHHAGAYQCFAHNQFESVQAASFVRVLDDPPKFRETFKSDLYQPNQEISLHCAARANPLPEITWTIDEMPLLDVEASTSLRIRFGDFVTRDNLVVSYVNISQARVSDSGLYRCTADNRLARVSHEAQISIWGEPQVKAMPNVTVLAGGGFRQRCPVAGWPLGDVQWLHNGHRLPTNHRQHVHENGTLEVEHMERSAGDEGEYTCQVLGGGGGGSPGSTSSSSSSSKDSPASAGQKSSAAQGSVWVSIRAKPTIEPFAISRQLREGQRASIMCTISSGDLPIGISWFRNGDLLVPLSPAGPDWSQSSSGLTPSANNNNHQAVAMVPINRNPHQHQHHHTASQLLPDEPLAGPPPPSPSSTTTTTTAMNPSGQLNSNIQQQPGPSLAGVRISRVSDYSSTLLFESLLSIHTGNYTCLARNDAGQSSHQAPMVVQGE